MLNPIRKEEDIAKDAIKMEMARKVLEAAMHAVEAHDHTGTLDHSLLAEHFAKKREEERRKEKCKRVLGTILGLAGTGAFAACIIREVKEAKEVEAAYKDEEQKELYRKLAAIKGKQA